MRYLVRRLGAYRSVWWSLANEYDLLWSKTVDDWERLAAMIVAEDPARHLLSIHNCFGFYDYSRPWITHASMQRIDVYRTAENTDAWREQWGKPVVIDECAYEGDIDQGWGNITGEELTRRFWEGAVRGGYVGHGETYLNDREELWWSKGGELVGESPAAHPVPRPTRRGVADRGARPAARRMGSAVGRRRGGVPHRVLRLQPAELPHGDRAARTSVHGRRDRHVGMTVERLDGVFEGTFRVPLPARQYMAVRLVAVRVAPTPQRSASAARGRATSASAAAGVGGGRLSAVR